MPVNQFNENPFAAGEFDRTGSDVSFITVTITDRKGMVRPASNRVWFAIDGKQS